MSLETPLASKYVPQKIITAAAGLTQGAVIGAHYRFNAPLDQSLESGQVGFKKVFLGNNRVKSVAEFLRAGMNSIMFCTGGKF